jgi:glycosyltransferase involved in cell wall biosynthesis
MKILIVSRFNNILPNGITPFIDEQAKDLIKKGSEVDFFTIKGKSYYAYFIAILQLNNFLNKNKYDIIHSHYGLSSIVAVLQRKVPVVVSLVGCDVNLWFNRLLNKFTTYKLSKIIIFVSDKLRQKSRFRGESEIIPYGIDLVKFYPIEKKIAQNKLDISKDKINILFSSRFDRVEKNYGLAKKAVAILKKEINVSLIEFKNIDSKDINYCYNSSDVFLMTSIREGSPQSIKEAMACNIPIVSTDVGDVEEVIGKTDGCYITTFEPEDVAKTIKKALDFGKRTTGRDNIKHFESGAVAQKIIAIYKKVLEK